MSRRKLAIAAGVSSGILAVVLVIKLLPSNKVTFVTGAVVRDSADGQEQMPVGDALITASSGETKGEGKSDSLGFFRLRLRPSVYRGEPITLQLRHPDYQPVEVTSPAEDRIHVIRMPPKPLENDVEPDDPRHTLANVRVRYVVKTTSSVNVGSAAKAFEIVNTGNIPCNEEPPCSPDNKWKAAVGSVSLDAGDGNEFGRARVSCIAGPCPFTKVETDALSADRRILNVSVRNWSDTATYLVEAEVTGTMVSDGIRHSYPVIFGRSMSFTLPATAQGPSIEAEMDGSEIVYPLGPSLTLSWAHCSLEITSDRTKLYRCKLKSGYRFE